MVNVLLLGAGGNAGINYVKSLKKIKNHYHVVGCDLDFFNLESCNSDEKVLLEPKIESDKIENLCRLVRDKKIDHVHAQPDTEVHFLLKNQHVFEKKIFPHKLTVWENCHDKLFCQKTWAQKLGLSFPCYSLSELVAHPQKFADLLTSSGKAWIRATQGAGSKAALPVNQLRQAQDWAHYWMSMRGLTQEDFMVAEYLDGEEFAVQTFWVDGELVQSQARQRIVYFFGNIMPSGQSSTPAVAATVHDSLVYQTAYQATLAIDPCPHGIYCVDLKKRNSGECVPLEINYGRFFTTSDFVASLGVNTPHAVIEYLLLNKKVHAIETIKEKYFWIRGLDKEPTLYSQK